MTPTRINQRKKFTIQIGEMSVDGLASLVMAFAVAHMPWLAWGPLDNVITFFLKKVFHKFFKEGIITVNAIIIDLDINLDTRGMVKALKALRKPSVVPEQIRKDNDAIREAMRELVHVGRARL